MIKHAIQNIWLRSELNIAFAKSTVFPCNKACSLIWIAGINFFILVIIPRTVCFEIQSPFVKKKKKCFVSFEMHCVFSQWVQCSGNLPFISIGICSSGWKGKLHVQQEGDRGVHTLMIVGAWGIYAGRRHSGTQHHSG